MISASAVRETFPSERSVVPVLREQLEMACAEFLQSTEISATRRREFVIAVERLLRDAKLEALAEFAAGAGHEINNPVATIVGRSQLLLSEEADPNRALALQIIGGQALRIRDMIADVMLFARPPHPRPETHRVSELMSQVIESQQSLVQERQASISMQVPEDLSVWADRTQLLVLLSSLLRNSLEQMTRAGLEVRLTAEKRWRQDQLWAVLSVIDRGPGIPPQVRDHLFDPFFSGREAGRGLGFGLTKCWRIAQMHGGMIEVSESSEGETCFEVWLPCPAE